MSIKMLTIWSLAPLSFLNIACTSGSSLQVHILSKPASLKNFEHKLPNMCNKHSLFEHSLKLPFFGIGMKPDLFQSCGHWVFQIFWHIQCSTLTAPSFTILDSWAGISSPLLALFVVMLLKAYLTSYSRMSGSRWVTTPSWFSGHFLSKIIPVINFFVQFFCVFLPPLLNFFCFC